MPPIRPNPPRRGFRLLRKARFAHARQFEAVYEAKVKKTSGPLVLHALPNELAFCRLGLAIGRRVGGAVVRTRLKRLLRESFRLAQHDLPTWEKGGYDLIIGAKAHRELAQEEYQKMIMEMSHAAHREWERRRRRANEKADAAGESTGEARAES